MVTTLLDEGLRLCDGPRWHDDVLWFSDLNGGWVHTIDLVGAHREVLEVPEHPSGLAFLPDGSMLIVSMLDQRILRRTPAGDVSEYADLSGVARSKCNDMVVDSSGHAYVTCFGFDLGLGEPQQPTPIMRVDPDGRVSIAADGLIFPNGIVLTDDERTLLVAESVLQRITAFDVARDGSLSGPRPWAQIPGRSPDGMCLDAEGRCWVGCVQAGELVRVAEGGEILDAIGTPGRWATACMLGGPERKHLFMLSTETTLEDFRRGIAHGRVEVAEVAVAGAGRP